MEIHKNKKEATSLQVIKFIGGISCILGYIYLGPWAAGGILIFDLIVIAILEAVYYDNTEFVRWHLRESVSKGVFFLIALALLVVVGILFSRSLFQGFVALIAVIILWLLISRD